MYALHLGTYRIYMYDVCQLYLLCVQIECFQKRKPLTKTIDLKKKNVLFRLPM